MGKIGREIIFVDRYRREPAALGVARARLRRLRVSDFCPP
jgi:hypothetical protein